MYPDRDTFDHEQLYPARDTLQHVIKPRWKVAWQKVGKTLPVFTFEDEHNKGHTTNMKWLWPPLIKFRRVFNRYKDTHKILISFVFLYELLMSFHSSRKQPPSIVLPCSRLQELILINDQLTVWLL